MAEPAILMRHEPDPPAGHVGLTALLQEAARKNPTRIVVEDDECGSTAGEMLLRCSRLADQLRFGGLLPGERVLVVAGAQAASVVALIAALDAGLEPVVVPVDIGPVELAGIARTADAAALIGPSRYGTLDLGDVYLSAAALADGIRGVLTHGAEPVDGAVDISFSVLDAMPGDAALEHPAPARSPVLLTVAAPRSATPRLVSHQETALLANAASLVAELRMEPSQALISLLPPAGLPALLGGLYAAFAGGARFVLHGPFAAGRFLALCDGHAPYHLLAPAAAAPALVAAGAAGEAASLMLVSRVENWPASTCSADLRCPVIDLQAFGEETVHVRRRASAVPDRLEVEDHFGHEPPGSVASRGRAAL